MESSRAQPADCWRPKERQPRTRSYNSKAKQGRAAERGGSKDRQLNNRSAETISSTHQVERWRPRPIEPGNPYIGAGTSAVRKLDSSRPQDRERNSQEQPKDPNSLTEGGVPLWLNERQEEAINAAMAARGLFPYASVDRGLNPQQPEELPNDFKLKDLPEWAEIPKMRKAILSRLSLASQRADVRNPGQSKNSRRKHRYAIKEVEELERCFAALQEIEAEVEVDRRALTQGAGLSQNLPAPKVSLQQLQSRLPRDKRAPPVPNTRPKTLATANQYDYSWDTQGHKDHGLASLPPNNFLRLTANSLIAQQDPTFNPRPSQPRHRDPITRPSAASGGVPEPTPGYLRQMSKPKKQTLFRQPLLLVMDLNGTLLYRPKRSDSGNFKAREGAERFLSYALDNFKVMIWSSARANNVDLMCKRLLPVEQRGRLVAEWSREHFGLTREDYNKRVQVYKRLTLVWQNRIIQGSHPYPTWAWDQSNTVLIDDSLEKGRSEPGNILVMPEFAGQQEETPVLENLIQYLEQLKYQQDVSSFISKHKFGDPLPKFVPVVPEGLDHQEDDVLEDEIEYDET